MLKLEARPQASRLWTYASPLLALALTVVLGVMLFVALGKDPVRGLQMFFWEPLKSGYALGELMVKATPLLLIALGLAVCFRSNVWNIGAEGQLTAGAILGSAIPVFFPEFQSPLTLVLMLSLGVIGDDLLAIHVECDRTMVEGILAQAFHFGDRRGDHVAVIAKGDLARQGELATPAVILHGNRLHERAHPAIDDLTAVHIEGLRGVVVVAAIPQAELGFRLEFAARLPRADHVAGRAIAQAVSQAKQRYFEDVAHRLVLDEKKKGRHQ
mgnify:CR=1 FL=1